MNIRKTTSAILVVIVALFLSACSTAATPTPVPSTPIPPTFVSPTAMSVPPTPTPTPIDTPTQTITPTLSLPVSLGTSVPQPLETLGPGVWVEELAQWQVSDSVIAMAFSPDGKILASSGAVPPDYNITLWDTTTGEKTNTLNPQSIAAIMSFSPNGKILASGLPDEMKIILWDVVGGSQIRTLIPSGTFKILYSLAFSPDGSILATGWKGRIILWDTATGENIRTINFMYDSQSALSLAFSPDGKLLAATQCDNAKYSTTYVGKAFPDNTAGRLFLYDPSSGENVTSLLHWDSLGTMPLGDIYVAFSQDGSKVVAISANTWIGGFTIGYFDEGRMYGNSLPNIFIGGGGVDPDILSASMSPDGRLLAVGGVSAEGGGIEGIDITDFRGIAGIGMSVIWMYWSGPSAVTNLIFSPDGRYLASSDNKGVVRLFGVWKK